MKTIVETFILREKTRLSELEAHRLLELSISSIMGKSYSEAFLDLTLNGNIKIYISCLMLFVNDMSVALIELIKTSPNGEIYLNNPGAYEIKYLNYETGNPPEDTRVAIVFANNFEQSDDQILPIEVSEFVERGSHWEKLQRWGDALQCYRIGLDLFPDANNLRLCLSSIMLKFDFLLPNAYKILTELFNELPVDGKVAYQLGKCCQLIADSQFTEIKDISREKCLSIALCHLERAAVIMHTDNQVYQDLITLRFRLNTQADNCFFKRL
jgi:hypothetical protein